MRVLTKIKPNLWEEAYFRGYEIIEKEVDRLLNESWEYNLEGEEDLASKYNKAANYHFYLLHYGVFLRKDIDRNSQNTLSNCEVLVSYKINCIEDNLQCLSINMDTDYVTVWKELKQTLGIDMICASTENECCLGIINNGNRRKIYRQRRALNKGHSRSCL